MLDRIDADLYYRSVSLPAVVDSESRELLYTTAEAANALKAKLRPWVIAAKADTPPTDEDMAAMWLKEFGNLIDG